MKDGNSSWWLSAPRTAKRRSWSRSLFPLKAARAADVAVVAAVALKPREALRPEPLVERRLPAVAEAAGAVAVLKRLRRANLSRGNLSVGCLTTTYDIRHGTSDI